MVTVHSWDSDGYNTNADVLEDVSHFLSDLSQVDRPGSSYRLLSGQAAKMSHQPEGTAKNNFVTVRYVSHLHFGSVLSLGKKKKKRCIVGYMG